MFALKIAFARVLFRLHVALSYVRAAVHYAEHRALTKQNRVRVAARNAAAQQRIALTEAAAQVALNLELSQVADLRIIAEKAGRL